MDCFVNKARNEGVNWHLICDGEKLEGAQLFVCTKNKYLLYKLNGAAALLWLVLDGSRTFNEIANDACDRYDIVSKDSHQFFFQLEEKGLLQAGIIQRYESSQDWKVNIKQAPRLQEHVNNRKEIPGNWHRDVVRNLGRYNTQKQFHYPLKVNFDITNSCNLKCSNCYFFGDNKETDVLDLSLSQVKKIIDKLVASNVSTLNLFGGEPFCREDIFEVIEYARSQEMKVVVNTNATILDARKIELLKDLACSLHISLDGSRSETHNALRGKHKTFWKAVRVIILAAKAGVPVQLNFTANRHNVYEMFSIYFLAKRLSVPNVAISFACNLGRAKDRDNLKITFIQRIYVSLFKTFLRFVMNKLVEVHFIKCDAHTYTHIAHDGDLCFCVKMGKSVPLGNVLKDDLLNMWRSERYASLFDSSKLKEPCGSCLFTRTCLYPGCRAEIYHQTGDIYSGVKNCFRGRVSNTILKLMRLLKMRKI